MRKRHNPFILAILLAALAACSAHKPMEWQSGSLQNLALSELSGLAASDIYPNVLYGINDSGSNGNIFRLAPDGKDLGKLQIKGIMNLDTEAMAYGNCKFAPKCLFIADIGDNFSIRPNLSIHIIAEPTLEQKEVTISQTINFKYPDGAHDAESMFVNNDGEIFIIQKNYGKKLRNIKQKVFKLDTKNSTDKKINIIATEIGEIPLTSNNNKRISALTDAVIAKDNTLYIRDYYNVFKVANFTGAQNFNILKFEEIETEFIHSAEAMTLINNDKTLVLSGEGVSSLIKTKDIQ